MSGELYHANACISLHKVNKYFGSSHILTDVTLDVPFGSIYGLLGPSGCGKTTTVKIIAGISKATEGCVTVLRKPMPSIEQMQTIGYMAQSDALYAALTARQNMEFFGMLYGMHKPVLRERISQMAALVNLTDVLEKPVSAYSGGMKRRLSLAISLLHNPRILILDEPTVGIDPLMRKEIWDELEQLCQNGVTILVTTHVMDEAEKCTELAMMRGGRLIASGTPAEIAAAAGVSRLEDAFLYYSQSCLPNTAGKR